MKVAEVLGRRTVDGQDDAGGDAARVQE
jgi:hypothetical protein